MRAAYGVGADRDERAKPRNAGQQQREGGRSRGATSDGENADRGHAGERSDYGPITVRSTADCAPGNPADREGCNRGR
jgi:hypothetical protein